MANTKIDSIKLAGSTETFDIDLPKTATPSIAGLTVNGSVNISGDNPIIHGNTSLNITSDKRITINASTITDIGGANAVNLYSSKRINLTAENSDTSFNTVIGLAASHIGFSPFDYARFHLPPTDNTTASKNTITLDTSEFIDSNSPCITLANNTELTSVSGKIGITYPNGIGLVKTYDGSAGYNTYLTVDDNIINMGFCDNSSSYNNFATFKDKEFKITLSENIMSTSGNPDMNIIGTLSRFAISFPRDISYIDIHSDMLEINKITPKITTSQGELIEYPGCGYTGASDDSYRIPSRSELKSISADRKSVV